MDAYQMLSRDHEKVDGLFRQFERATRRSEMNRIAERICHDLIVHATLEEEIFYPACREHVQDDKLDEAQVEHDAAKTLLAEIMAGDADDPYFAAKVNVLAEMIRHHVHEEEQAARSIFAQARRSGLDADRLAQRMQRRREELEQMVERGELNTLTLMSFSHLPGGTVRAGQSRGASNGARDHQARPIAYGGRETYGGAGRDERNYERMQDGRMPSFRDSLMDDRAHDDDADREFRGNSAAYGTGRRGSDDEDLERSGRAYRSERGDTNPARRAQQSSRHDS
jgi:hypothetical protein